MENSIYFFLDKGTSDSDSLRVALNMKDAVLGIGVIILFVYMNIGRGTSHHISNSLALTTDNEADSILGNGDRNLGEGRRRGGLV